MKTPVLKYARLAEGIGGLAVFLLAVWIWWRMFQWPPSDGTKFGRDEAWLLLMMVGPGLLVALGTFFQAMYRWVWLAVLVFLASALAAYMGLAAWFLFGYTGNSASLPPVYFYLGVILVTVVFSLANAGAELALRSHSGAEQIVEHERR